MPSLSPRQLDALRHAAYRPNDGTGRGFLYGRTCGAGIGLTRYTGLRNWRASCSCGRVLMQPLDGRACLGLLSRGLIRQGADYTFDSETWARFVVTARGRDVLAALKPTEVRWQQEDEGLTPRRSGV